LAFQAEELNSIDISQRFNDLLALEEHISYASTSLKKIQQNVHKFLIKRLR